ncbi:hypothetical protein RI129_008007 [Pyrocoelia pectoralis]|uniref:SET domain-containing protein n=1 Tax=Pyrocoelia pectoralis TaxID=417401 RepID=A0AAN7ZHI0_9COLE
MQPTDVTKNQFQIRHNDTVGRYAVADSDLKSGDEVFSETPFAIGPKSDGPPVCLGCHTPVDCSTLCSSCKWPVCGELCEIVSTHKEAECIVFTKAKVKFQGWASPCLQYECIMPLRVLLAMLRNHDRWNFELKMMESHDSIRRTQEIWKFNQINIVNYLRGPCKLSNFTDELIHKVCGILECNAFEARAKCGYSIRCLYPKLAILSHNCVSNTVHTISSDNFTVTIRTSTDVCRGEELFSSYTYALWPTLVRNEFLLESKYFQCKCERCSDPTEMGTHMSSLKCSDKCDGVLKCTSPLERGNWVCSLCTNCKTYTEVKTLFTAIQTEIEQNLNGEELLTKYETTLHPNNAYFVIIKSSLLQLYRLQKQYDKAAQFAKDVLQVVNVIQPGCTRIRGMTLYELFLSTISSDTINLKHKVDEALGALRECVTILQLESDITNEGIIGKQANRQLEQLEHNYTDVIEGKCNVYSILS